MLIINQVKRLNEKIKQINQMIFIEIFVLFSYLEWHEYSMIQMSFESTELFHFERICLNIYIRFYII